MSAENYDPLRCFCSYLWKPHFLRRSRKNFYREASNLSFTSCTVVSGSLGRPPSFRSNNVYTVSIIFTKYWMIEFSGDFLHKLSLETFMDSVFHYVRSMNTRCSILYLPILLVMPGASQGTRSTLAVESRRRMHGLGCRHHSHTSRYVHRKFL